MTLYLYRVVFSIYIDTFTTCHDPRCLNTTFHTSPLSINIPPLKNKDSSIIGSRFQPQPSPSRFPYIIVSFIDKIPISDLIEEGIYRKLTFIEIFQEIYRMYYWKLELLILFLNFPTKTKKNCLCYSFIYIQELLHI